MRQLASGLAVPTIIFDDEGEMLFYNEPAEVLLGQRFDDVGDLPLDLTQRIFLLRDEKSRPLLADQVWRWISSQRPLSNQSLPRVGTSISSVEISLRL